MNLKFNILLFIFIHYLIHYSYYNYIYVNNVLNNDTISGDQADATTVTISVLNDGGVSGITISPNGVVIIPANTPAGTYTVDYQICDVLNPSNCSTASATLSVGAGTLNANDDDLTASQINGYQGGTLNGIFDNDLLNNYNSTIAQPNFFPNYEKKKSELESLMNKWEKLSLALN